MKKMLLTLLLAVITTGASAQFEKGTTFVKGSLSGLGVSYGNETWNFGIGAEGGYYIADEWLILGNVGFEHAGEGNNRFDVGVAGRYSWKKNGLYGQAGLDFEHSGSSANFFSIVPEVGYTFYVNRFMAIEPAVYWKCCLNEFEFGNKAGFKVGLALYF